MSEINELSSHPSLLQPLVGETPDEEHCINDMQQILKFLQSFGTPPSPTDNQLGALCNDIKQLMIDCQQLSGSPLIADQKMAQWAELDFTAQIGDFSLSTAAAAYDPFHPDSIEDMRETFDRMVSVGAFPTLLEDIQSFIANPFGN